jgi:hypothetical protein
VAIAFLLGIGAFVGSLFGRRAMQNAALENSNSERRVFEKVARELEHCVELGACISRDANSVSALLEEQASAVPPDLLGAMQKLIKTTKTLSGRLARVDDETSLSDPSTRESEAPREESHKPPERKAQGPKAPEPKAPAKPVTLPTVTEKKKEADPAKAAGADSDETRRFPRSPCHGNLKATIYPPPSSRGGEPVQCTVLTRDLSCGGIGIAHAEQLYPRQIVVLDAVGKLLVGEVRWCRQLDERFYIAGCRLVKTSD